MSQVLFSSVEESSDVAKAERWMEKEKKRKEKSMISRASVKRKLSGSKLCKEMHFSAIWYINIQQYYVRLYFREKCQIQVENWTFQKRSGISLKL